MENDFVTMVKFGRHDLMSSIENDVLNLLEIGRNVIRKRERENQRKLLYKKNCTPTKRGRVT